MADERQQFAHAMRNARLHPRERFRIYRHRVVKVVEPGAEWHDLAAAVSMLSNCHEIGEADPYSRWTRGTERMGR